VTYADGAVFAVDDSTLTSYLSILKKLASLAVQPDTSATAVLNEKGAHDHELRNRFVSFSLRGTVQNDTYWRAAPLQNTLDWSRSPVCCGTK